MNAALWQRLRHAAGAYKVVTMPVTVAATGAAGTQLYKSWNPDSYAQWYLWNISAGEFREPLYKKPWVRNERMTKFIKDALKDHPDQERMTLISGLQISGKTSAVMKECHEQKKVGFFVGLGKYQGKKDNEEKIGEFFAKNLIANRQATNHGFIQNVMWWFFPVPEPEHAWAGLKGAFEQHPQKLVLVVDETQNLANEVMKHGGILNVFCQASLYGIVILIASEFAVAQYFQHMTHIAERTTTVYSRSASAEEMRPHVKERFEKDFGPEGVEHILSSCAGSFKLLCRLDEHRPDGIEGVREWHKEQLTGNLQLTKDGMKNETKATNTGEAMVAAAELAFGLPVEAINKGTLELAQAGGAKIETSGSKRVAAWAAPLTGEVMKELVCDKAVHAVMKKRVPPEIYDAFQEVTKDRCPPAPAEK